MENSINVRVLTEKLKISKDYLNLIAPWIQKNNYQYILLLNEIWIATRAKVVALRRVTSIEGVTVWKNVIDDDYKKMHNKFISIHNELYNYYQDSNPQGIINFFTTEKSKTYNIKPTPFDDKKFSPHYLIHGITGSFMAFVTSPELKEDKFIIELYGTWELNTNDKEKIGVELSDFLIDIIKLFKDESIEYSSPMYSNVVEGSEKITPKKWKDNYRNSFLKFIRRFSLKRRIRRFVSNGQNDDFGKFITDYKEYKNFKYFDKWLNSFFSKNSQIIFSFREQGDLPPQIFYTSNTMEMLSENDWCFEDFVEWIKKIDRIYKLKIDPQPPEKVRHSKWDYVNQSKFPLLLEFDYKDWEKIQLLEYWKSLHNEKKSEKRGMQYFETMLFKFDTKGTNTFLFVPLIFEDQDGEDKMLAAFEFGKKGKIDDIELRNLIHYANFQIPMLRSLNELRYLNKAIMEKTEKMREKNVLFFISLLSLGTGLIALIAVWRIIFK